MSSVFEAVVINNDALEFIANFLDGKSLVNLSLTSKQLKSEVNTVALHTISSSNARYGGEDVDELATLEELNYLRSPLVWNELLGNRIGYVDGDMSCVYSSNPNTLHTPEYIAEETMMGRFDDWQGTEQTAIASDYIMTSGKHFAKFKITTCCPIVIFRYVYCRIGIMRPISSEWKEEADWSEFCPIHNAWFNNFLVDKTPAWGDSNVHCCLYYDFEGTCDWSNWKPYPDGKKEDRWEGMKSFDIYDGELGLLLDLDEGTLSVYKNGTRLGTMMSGLSGEYVWVAQITAQANGRPDEQNVRIKRAPVPSNLSGYEVVDSDSSSESDSSSSDDSSQIGSSDEENDDDSSEEEGDSSSSSSEGGSAASDDSAARHARTRDFIFELMRHAPRR